MVDTAFQVDGFQNNGFQIGEGGGLGSEPGGGGFAYYAPSEATVNRIWRLLYGKPRKRMRKAKRLELAAEALMQEFEPGPNLPPLDLTALKRAMAMLDRPPGADRREVVEALFDKAAELQRGRLVDEDDEIILLSLYLH